ncbi:DUF4340 domain-containing protein [Synechococcus moorigangaii CMS01]|nr:DUF4340 domain-containing protein [Synechococcus moorigangaii CMS01]
MLQRSTGIWLAIAFILGGLTLMVVHRQNLAPQSETASETAQVLFPLQETEIQTINLAVNGETFVFEQRFEPVNQWWLTTPITAPANRGAIAYLLNLLVEPQPQRQFSVAATQWADYGLAIPTATIIVQTQTEQRYQLDLGAENFDQTKIYGRLGESAKVLILPIEFRYGITRSLSEWVVDEADSRPEN